MNSFEKGLSANKWQKRSREHSIPAGRTTSTKSERKSKTQECYYLAKMFIKIPTHVDIVIELGHSL